MLFKSPNYTAASGQYYDEIELFENGMARCKTYKVQTSDNFLYYGLWKRFGDQHALIMFDNKDDNFHDGEIGFYHVNLKDVATGDYVKLNASQIKSLMGPKPLFT